MIKDLSPEQAREMLRRSRLGRLACIADGEPYVVPVNYVFDGEHILVHSLPGHKVMAMRANPRVCLQADEIENELDRRSVQAFGDYEEITDRDERSHPMHLLLSSFPKLTPVETVMADDAGTPDPIVFRIRLRKLSGLGEG